MSPVVTENQLSKQQACLPPLQTLLSFLYSRFGEGQYTPASQPKQTLGVVSSPASQSLNPTGPTTSVFPESDPHPTPTHEWPYSFAQQPALLWITVSLLIALPA